MLNKMKSASKVKKLFLTFLATVFITLGFTIPVLAKSDKAQGPAEKTTGMIEVERNDDIKAYAEFNAHEAYANKNAKGIYSWWAINPDGSLYRRIKVDISDVYVDGNMASFKGQAVYDSMDQNIGKWLLINVEDNGEPGTNGDIAGWKWFNTEPGLMDGVNNKVILSGNLQVHSMQIEE